MSVLQREQAKKGSIFSGAPTVNQGQWYQSHINGMKQLQSAFNTVNSMSGEYRVRAINSATATERFARQLDNERLSMTQLIRSRKLFNATLKDQIALQRASVVSFGNNAQGRAMNSVLIPNNAIPDSFKTRVKDATTQIGMLGQAMRSAGNAGGEWARGMQRTGFQITQGIGVPLAALGAAFGYVFYQVDKQLTSIAKVYDTTVDKTLSKQQQLASQQQELDNLRSSSLENAKRVAGEYGSTINETLNAEAELAASGLKGAQLLKATNEVQRISILGQLDQQDALKATISMQSLFQQEANASGDASKYLADQFNLMNKIENQTSLTTQDMVQAFPKVMPVLKSVGGSMEDFVILMTAMKAGGVAATEGANALKSGMGSLQRPTTVTVKALEAMGVQIKDIPEKAGGDMIKMLIEFNKRTQGLEKNSRLEAFYRIFGKEQASRMLIVSEQLNHIDNDMTQVGRAFDVTQQSTEEWGETARTEMERLQASASATFKRMVSTLQAGMVAFGEPVLEVATTILGYLNKFIEWFNKIPSAAQKALIWATVFTVVGGAVLLVVGAFANLLYTIGKVGGSLLTFATRFRTLSAEQLSARAATAQTTNAQNAQAASLSALTGRLGAFSAAARGAAAAQLGLAAATQRAVAAPGTTAIVGGSTNRQTSSVPAYSPASAQYASPIGPVMSGFTANGREYRNQANKSGNDQYSAMGKGGGNLSREQYLMAQRVATETAKTQKAQAQITADARDHNRSMGNIIGAASSIALAVPAMAQWRRDGEMTATSMVMMGLAVATMLPLIQSAAVAMKAIGVTAMAGGLKAALGSAVAMLGPVGLILAGAVAIGAAWYGINKHMNKAREEAEAINDSAKTWSDVLGYTNIQLEQQGAGANSSMAKQISNQEKLKKANEKLYESFKNINSEQEAIARSRIEALKVVATGGSKDQAAEAMRTVLGLADVGVSRQNEIIDLNVDFTMSNPEEAKKALVAESSKLVKDAFKEIENQSAFLKFWNSARISKDSEEAAILAGGTFAEAFKNEVDEASQADMLKGLRDNWNSQSDVTFRQMRAKGKNAKLFDELGIKNMTDLTKAMKEAQAADQAGLNTMVHGQIQTRKLTDDQKKRLQVMNSVGNGLDRQLKLERTHAQAIARSLGYDDKRIKSISNLNDLIGATGVSLTSTQKPIMATTGELNALSEEATGTADAIAEVDEETKELQNSLREGLKSTMDDTMSSVYDAFARQREQEQEAALNNIERAGEARLDRLEAEQEAKEASFDARQDAADTEFENRQKSLRRAQEEETKEFESRWKEAMKAQEKAFEDQKEAVEESYDARIDAIDAEIEAQEKAEEIRQRIFEAEQARIQRLSEMYNRNIDFNVALNSGNLDEAAKIQNDAATTGLQWAQDDSNAVAGSGADARREALEKQKELLDEQRQVELDAINATEEAEKEQFEARKDREKELLELRQSNLQEQLAGEQEAWNKSLEQERSRYGQSIEEQRKSITAQTENATRSEQAKQEIQNRSLELQLNTLKAYTPRNEAELNAHIERLRGTYNTFGTDYIKPTGKSWGEVFGNEQKAAMDRAATAIRNDINWSDVGSHITNEMAKPFDITGPQLVEWLKTGNFPGGSAPAAGGGMAWKSEGGNYGPGYMFASHSGSVPWTSADRVGVPRSAGLYPSETLGVLKRGEAVMNERATRTYGPVLNAMNAGVARHSGGMVSGPFNGGIASGGLIGAAVGKAIAQGIARMLQGTVQSAGASYGAAAAGKYGNTNFNDEQLGNARTIMNVGKAMGASQRDLVIALATAMQESGLRNLNYGDRDSVGLFQQRGNGAWGTLQDRMDPATSASMFFKELLKIKDRDQLSVAQAAQKVQRSAFPAAYAKWEDEARDIVQGTPQVLVQGGGAGGAGLTAGLSVARNGYTYPALVEIMNRSGVDHQVTSTKRNGDGQSYHNTGKAVDFDDFSSPKVDTPGLYAIWKWLYDNFGSVSSELIYSGPGAVSLKNGSPYRYSPSVMAGHHNHVHWAMTPQAMAKIGVPQLAVGGNIKYDNTLANLHKGETVLTSSLSRDLEDGIQNMGSGGGVTVHIDTLAVREEADIERVAAAIQQKIAVRERRNGTKRVIR